MNSKKAESIIKKNRESYDEIAKLFDSTRKEDWPEFELLKKYLKKDNDVLDIGCGNGRLYSFLKKTSLCKKYLGIDQSKELIDLAKNNYKDGDFLVVDNVLKLPFADNSFDTVVAIAFFHHIPSNKLRRKMLYEIKRVLKPGGILFMTNWNLWQKNLWQKYNIKWWQFFLPHNGLDAGDFWVRFKSGKVEANRYYHHFWGCEIKRLCKRVDFKVKDYTDIRGFNGVIVLEK